MAETPNNAPTPQQVNDAQHLDNMTSLQQPSAAEQSPITQSSEVRGDAPVANTPTPSPDNPSLFNEVKNPNNKVVEVDSQKSADILEEGSSGDTASDQGGKITDDLSGLKGGNPSLAVSVQANGEATQGDTPPEVDPGVNTSGGNSGNEGPTGGGGIPRGGQAPAGKSAATPAANATPSASSTTTTSGSGEAPSAPPSPAAAPASQTSLLSAQVALNRVATVSSEAQVVVEGDTAIALNTSGKINVVDADSGQSFVQPQSNVRGTYGDFSIDANGNWTFTANSAYNGLAAGQKLSESFAVTSLDGSGKGVVSITINGTNDSPVITNSLAQLAGTVTEAGNTDPGVVVAGTASITGQLAATDVDANATQAWSITGTPSTIYGALTINSGTGLWTYTLNNSLSATQALKEGATATETYTVRVTDDKGAYVDQTVTITINGTNDSPVITNSLAQLAGSVTEAGNTDPGVVVAGTPSITGQLAATDADVDATQTWSITGTPSTTYGALTINSGTGLWTYTLDNSLSATQALKEGTTATETYTVRVVDDKGAYVDQTVTITINGTNDSPVIGAASVAVNEDATISGSVSATDVDAGETATLVYTLNSAAPTGLTFNADGTYSFDAASYDSLVKDATQVLTIPYTATDAQGATSVANLVITITGTNDAPVATSDSLTGTEDITYTVTSADLFGSDGVGVLNDFDIDSAGFVSITVTSLGVHGVLKLDGVSVTLNQVVTISDIAANKLTFTPDANFNGDASFKYTVSDGLLSSNEATATIAINPVVDTTIVSLSAPSDIDEATGLVTYTVSVGSAPQGNDLTLTITVGGVPRTVTIAQGALSNTFTVNTRSDDVYDQGPQTITTTVTNASGGNYENLDYSAASDSYVVTDDADAVTVNLSASSVVEGASVAYTFTATLSAASEGATTVVTNQGTITIADGQTTGTLVVPVTNGDDVYVDASSLTATITSVSGGNFENPILGTTTSATAHVTDDADAVTVTLSSQADKLENGSAATYTVSVDHAPSGSDLVLTVNVNGVNQDVTILAGQTSAQFDVATRADNLTVDADSSYVVTVTGASGGNYENLVYGSATDTFVVRDETYDDVPGDSDTLDNNDVVTFKVVATDSSGNIINGGLTNSVLEGETAHYKVVAVDQTGALITTQPTTGTVTVVFTNGSASNGDYSPGASTATVNIGSIFTAGATLDANNEPLETFTVGIQSGTYSSGPNFESTAYDTTPVVTTIGDVITVNNVTVYEEGAGYAQFTVTTASGIAGQAITLTLAGIEATGGGADFGSGSSATNLEYSTNGGGTWQQVSGTIAATGGIILVRTPITNDAIADSGESFTLTATVGSGSAIGTATILDSTANDDFGAGNLADNQIAYTLKVFAVDASGNLLSGVQSISEETGESAHYKVVAVDINGNPLVSGQPSGTVIVAVGANTDTADIGVDYISDLRQEVNIGQVFSVAAVNDAIPESSESFTVGLVDGSFNNPAVTYEGIAYNTAPIQTIITSTDAYAVPIAKDYALEIVEGTSSVPGETVVQDVSSNLMIVMDVSGSMGSSISGALGTKTRLEYAKIGAKDLIDAYDALGDVMVQVVKFSSTATVANSGEWMTVAQAKTYINSLTAGSYTNYDKAIDTAMTVKFDGTKGSLLDAQNVSYFFSDGNPTEDSAGKRNTSFSLTPGSTTYEGQDIGIQAGEEWAWKQFLQANDVTSYAYGVGNPSINLAYLDPIAWNGGSASNINAVFADITNLAASVTMPTVTVVTQATYGGNLLTQAGAESGADGWGNPKLVSFAYNGTTYTFDVTHTSFTITLDNGTFTINNQGDYSFTPGLNAADVGSAGLNANITYTVQDDTLDSNNLSPIGDTSSATFTISITDRSAVIAYDNTNSGSIVSGNVITNPDSSGNVDSPGLETAQLKILDGLAYQTPPVGGYTVHGAYGDLVIMSDGSYTYNITTPNPTDIGQQDTFTYQLVQPDGDSDPANLVITITNTAPIAISDSLAATEDTPVTYTAAQLIGNDTDADGNALTIASVASVTGGTAVLNPNGTVTFTPTANFNGSASFTYTVTDGMSASNSATANITVAAVNDAAIISGDISGSVIEAGGIANATPGTPTASGTLTDTDVDNTPNVFQAVTSQSTSVQGYGTYTVTAGGVWTYTLNDNNSTVQALNSGQSLTDTFNVLTADGTTQVITITINGADDITNNAPVAGSDSVLTNAASISTLPAWALLANDSDANSDALSITAVSNGSGLTSQSISAGVISAGGVASTDTLNYTLSDGTTTSTGIATFTNNSTTNITGTGAAEILINAQTTARTLTGGAGDDILIGNTGADILIGGIGADILFGGGGVDTFRFDIGESTYAISGSGDAGSISGFDVIKDYTTGSAATQDILDLYGTGNTARFAAAATSVDGVNSTLTISGNPIGSHRIISGGMISFDDANTFATAIPLTSNAHVAAVVQYLGLQDLGNSRSTVAFTATINGTVNTYIYTQTTTNAGSGNLIELNNVALTSIASGASGTAGVGRVTPIAIDLNKDGVQYLNEDAGVQYAYDANGDKLATAWVAPEDGLIANQRADGSLNVVFSTQAGETDLQGLAKVYDTNLDAVFDSRDAGFNEFGVWQDADSDGIVDAGEFLSLADRGIVSLSLTSDGVIHTAADGDVTIFGQTTYTMTDGSTGIAEDVAFAVSSVVTDGNGVQDVYEIASVAEAAVMIDDFSVLDGDRVDLSAILNPTTSVQSLISLDQDAATDSHSTITVNIGGVDYEVATLYGKEIGVPDALGTHASGSSLSEALHGASWTDVVDVSSDHGGPASISAAGGDLTNSYSNEAGDWTVQIKSGTATVDAANKQINFTSDHAGNEAIITTADGTAHEISNVDKILWH